MLPVNEDELAEVKMFGTVRTLVQLYAADVLEVFYGLSSLDIEVHNGVQLDWYDQIWVLATQNNIFVDVQM